MRSEGTNKPLFLPELHVGYKHQMEMEEERAVKEDVESSKMTYGNLPLLIL